MANNRYSRNEHTSEGTRTFDLSEVTSVAVTFGSEVVLGDKTHLSPQVLCLLRAKVQGHLWEEKEAG